MVDVLKWRPIKGRSHKNYQSKEFKKLCDCDSNLNFYRQHAAEVRRNVACHVTKESYSLSLATVSAQTIEHTNHSICSGG